MATTVAEKTGLEALLPAVPLAPRVVPHPTRQLAARKSDVKARHKPPREQKPAPPPLKIRVVKVASAPEEETQRDKTLRLGQGRMKNALRSVRLLGNLSTRNYRWEAGEVQRMREVLLRAVNETFNKFERTQERQRLEDTFSLVNTPLSE